MGTGRVTPVNKERNDRISYFSLTAGGSLLALKLRDRFGGMAHLPRCHSLGCGRCSPFDSLSEALPERFLAGDTVVCIMAAGIVFRLLAPHLAGKHEDPAVICMDEEGRHVIPLLGGHAAGANELAREMAGFTGGRAAVTTASDIQGLAAPDSVARLLEASPADPEAMRLVTSLLLDGKRVCIEAPADPGIDGYGWIAPGADTSGYHGRLLVTHLAPGQGGQAGKMHPEEIPTARLVPRMIAAGVGCRRGTPARDILAAIYRAFAEAGCDPESLCRVASAEIKQDEPGLREAAAALGRELVLYPALELAALGRQGSDFVAEKTGTPAVCEPAALLAAGEQAALLAGKKAYGPVTVALALGAATAAREPAAGMPLSRETNGGRAMPGNTREKPTTGATGRVLVVGIGTGTAGLLTQAAAGAIESADVVMGYRTYIEQVRRLFPGKEFIAGSMGREIERCRDALDLAASGKTVAMVSSGDPGIYGMAGPMLENADGVPVEVICGVTAAQAAAALLGAPLTNDFITLSLSDLLTPRDEVLRRAGVAAASDLVVCLYNPTSRKRQPLFEEVCTLLLEHRPPDTPVGWVRDAGGPGETAKIITLGKLSTAGSDMRTIVIVGNSKTQVASGKMVTRRGYGKGD